MATTALPQKQIQKQKPKPKQKQKSTSDHPSRHSSIVYVAQPDNNANVKKIKTTTTYIGPEKKKEEDIPTVNIRLPFSVQLLIYGIYAFIIFTMVLMLMAYLLSSSLRQWWSSNDGKKYNRRVFNINLLAQYRTSSIGYWIYSLFLPPSEKMSSGQAEFIGNLISAYGKFSTDNDDDEDLYFLLPKNICETIAVGTFDNSHLQQTCKKDDGCEFDEVTGWPANSQTWRVLLIYWGVPSGPDATPDIKKWQVDENFLYKKYHLQPLTPFILSFVWNKASYEGDTWYPSAFEQAVGLNEITIENVDYTGGWWGCVKYGMGDDNINYATIQRYLFSGVSLQTRGKCSSGDQGAIWGAGVAGGIASGGGILAFGATPVGALIVGGLSAFGSILSGYHGCGAF